MQRWHGLDSTPADWGRSVVTIGVFDGVHRGHQHIIGRAVELAETRGVRAVVVTFDPNPIEVVRPDARPPQLTDVEQRANLVAELGADGYCVLPFTREFSQLEPEAFVRSVLVDRLRAEAVVVGENFRYGHRAAGDISLLRELGGGFGFDTEAVELVREDTTVFSSSHIRARLAEGDVAEATEALGRPYRLSGSVVRGAGRGDSQLGFPTANLSHRDNAAVPADGVYAGWLRRVASNEKLPAAISVGSNPTFAGSGRSVEAYLLDFKADLYGEAVDFDFIARLREQRVYDSLPPLISQMETDVADTRSALGLV